MAYYGQGICKAHVRLNPNPESEMKLNSLKYSMRTDIQSWAQQCNSKVRVGCKDGILPHDHALKPGQGKYIEHCFQAGYEVFSAQFYVGDRTMYPQITKLEMPAYFSENMSHKGGQWVITIYDKQGERFFLDLDESDTDFYEIINASHAKGWKTRPNCTVKEVAAGEWGALITLHKPGISLEQEVISRIAAGMRLRNSQDRKRIVSQFPKRMVG